MRRKYILPLSSEDKIDLLFEIQKGEVVGFVINLRAWIADNWHEIYRIDTCHGYLHEQRFWISPNPIPMAIQADLSLKQVVNKYLEKVKQNYERYKKYYLENLG